MALLNLNETRAVKDPAPSWRWRVLMPIFVTRPNSVPSGFSVAMELPKGYATEVTLPGFNFDNFQFMANAHEFNFPGTSSAYDVIIKFYEDVEYNTTNYLQTWKYLVKGNDGNYGMPADYKYNITCHLHDAVDSSNAQMEVQLLGSWCKTADAITLDNSTSRNMELSATFSVDNVLFKNRVVGKNIVWDSPRVNVPDENGIIWDSDITWF